LIDTKFLEWKLSKVSIDNRQCGLLNELSQKGGGDGARNKAKATTEVVTTERTKVEGGGTENVLALVSQEPLMGLAIIQDTLELFAGDTLLS
jgi:hypothetical protein